MARLYSEKASSSTNFPDEPFVDGPNLYCYVRQNPWTKFDPEGLNGQHLEPSGDGSMHLVDDGPPCIQCHGVSAGGFNGNINSFRGIEAVTGNPNAMADMRAARNGAIAAA